MNIAFLWYWDNLFYPEKNGVDRHLISTKYTVRYQWKQNWGCISELRISTPFECQIEPILNQCLDRCKKIRL